MLKINKLYALTALLISAQSMFAVLDPNDFRNAGQATVPTPTPEQAASHERTDAFHGRDELSDLTDSDTGDVPRTAAPQPETPATGYKARAQEMLSNGQAFCRTQFQTAKEKYTELESKFDAKINNPVKAKRIKQATGIALLAAVLYATFKVVKGLFKSKKPTDKKDTKKEAELDLIS